MGNLAALLKHDVPGDLAKGDFDGHPFRGNQYVDGDEAGSLAKAAPSLPPGFWEEEMRRLAIILIPRLTSLVLEGMRSGTVKVGIGFNFAIYSVLAAQWAQDYTDQLLQQVRTTNESVVGEILARWIATPGRTIGDLRASLTPHFGVQRADTIAITEATRALASGEIMAFQRAGIEEIRWGTNNDELVCPHCGPLHGVVRKIGEVFGYFKWRKGAALEPVFSPPFHPNCRCGISPVVKLRRSAWGDVPNSLIVSATLAMIRPGGWDYAGDLAKHYGPGDHESGSPQDVHGGGQKGSVAYIGDKNDDKPIPYVDPTGSVSFMIAEQMKTLPESHMDEITGVYFEEGRFVDGAAYGTYEPQSRKIMIASNADNVKVIGGSTVIHEVGHHVHLSKMSDAGADEWLRISGNGQNARISAYARTCRGEHFAECYRAYFRGGESRKRLKQLEPESYKFMAAVGRGKWMLPKGERADLWLWAERYKD